MEIEYDPKIEDLTNAEANERYGIFHQAQLRMFASTQNECSQCHIRVEKLSGLNSPPIKACYIDNKLKAVSEQCRLKQQSKLIEECKKQNKNLMIVNAPWHKEREDQAY